MASRVRRRAPVTVVTTTAATATAAAAPTAERVSTGAGITAGLEIWRVGTKLVLVDRSPDGRFAGDVTTWNTAAGLNAATTLLLKDAAGKDSA